MTTPLHRSSLRATLAAGLFAVAIAAAAPASVAQVKVAPTSKVWLEGDSTLHAFKANATQLQATIGDTERTDSGVTLKDVSVVIPVKGLKSHDGGLDDNMYKALKADKVASIRFTSAGGQLKVSKSGAADVTLAGQLSIAGVTKPVTLKATGTLTGSDLKLKGSHALTMSTYGVQPPVIMGLIKVKDPVVVNFELVGKVAD